MGNSTPLVEVVVKVSACIITYNQEKFIAQAIEGALMQEVGFDYEIVIGEDGSTDNTRSIVLYYNEKFPGRIRPMLREENLGMMLNFIQTIQACRGQYIALCEGDDYWTSPYKLQKQVDFLDSEPDFAICSHNVRVIHEEGSHSETEWLGANHREVSTLKDLLREGSGGATCSLMFRNKIFGDFPAWYYTSPGGDWALQVLCASRGKFYYSREIMGVYRRHDRGSLYAATVEAKKKGEDAIALPSKNSLLICDLVSKHFDYRYESVIEKQRAYWYWMAATEYARHGRKNSARLFFLKALPHIFPLPHWLTFGSLVTNLLLVLLPAFVLDVLHSARSILKQHYGAHS